jgi:hypothetical protein
MRETVAYAALITWFTGVLLGLYMLTVWLIENDVTTRRAAPSRLPVPVILTHLTLAVSGLALWVAYLILDRVMLAWTAFALLGVIVLLGLTMFARWIPVYREPVPAPATSQTVPADSVFQAAPAKNAGQTVEEALAIPAEGNFPVAVVAMHGLLAGFTLVLVFLTAMGVGAS